MSSRYHQSYRRTTMKLKPIDGRKYFVHRHKWTHEAKRKQFLRAFKEEKAVLIQSTRDGWLYQWGQA